MSNWIIKQFEVPLSSQNKYWDFCAYEQSLLDDNVDHNKEILATLSQFCANEYDRVGYEVILSTEFGSLRTNGRHRLFFATIEQQINNINVRVAVFFDLHLEHKHGTYNPFKNPLPTLQYIEAGRDTIFTRINELNLDLTNVSAAIDEKACKRYTITYSHNHFIRLAAPQVDAIQRPLPLILNGAAGTGKTVVLMSLANGIKHKLKHIAPGYRPQIIFITPTKALADILSTQWNTEDKIDEDVFFSDYNSYLNDFLTSDQTLVDDDFIEQWYNRLVEQIDNNNKSKKVPVDDLFTLKNREKIIQSWKLFAGHSRDEIATRDIPLKSNDPQLKDKLYDKFLDLMTYFGNTHVHPQFFEFPPTSEDTKYDLFYIDEAQRFNFVQNKNIYNAAKQDGQSASCFSYDNHQTTNFMFSKRLKMAKLITQETGIQEPYVNLKYNQRSHPEHVVVADALVNIKYEISKGKGDEFEDNELLSIYQRGDYPEELLTGIHWPRNPRSENFNNMYDFDLVDHVDHYIVTHDQYREEAIQLFGSTENPPLIYSFSDALGSQGRRVLIYRPFDIPEFEQISQLLRKSWKGDYTTNSKLSRPVNLAKSDQSNPEYNPCLNMVISAFQRSQEYISVYQEQSPKCKRSENYGLRDLASF